MVTQLVGREVHLASRPVGAPTADNFALVERPVPTPTEGQVVVRNRFLSVDPYMRGRMDDRRSYVPAFPLGEVMTGGAVGQVVTSLSPTLNEGDWVIHDAGWREFAVLDAAITSRVDPGAVPSPSMYLGAFGMPGLTAYVGLLDIAGFRPGDTVFVSAAAGAVGTMVGQIARLRGARWIVGSAGSPRKLEYLTGQAGYDAAFDYHAGSVSDLLRAAAPEGIDVYFDNVGGDHLEAAISRMKVHGRIALCGAVGQYNSVEPPAAPRNLAKVIGKRISMRGFLVPDHWNRMPDWIEEATGWLRDGRLRIPESFAYGIGSAVDAFLRMMAGDNTGKMIVRLDPSG